MQRQGTPGTMFLSGPMNVRKISGPSTVIRLYKKGTPIPDILKTVKIAKGTLYGCENRARAILPKQANGGNYAK